MDHPLCIDKVYPMQCMCLAPYPLIMATPTVEASNKRRFAYARNPGVLHSAYRNRASERTSGTGGPGPAKARQANYYHTTADSGDVGLHGLLVSQAKAKQARRVSNIGSHSDDRHG